MKNSTLGILALVGFAIALINMAGVSQSYREEGTAYKVYLIIAFLGFCLMIGSLIALHLKKKNENKNK